MSNHKSYRFLLPATLVLTAGCSKFVQVEGTVTLDGKPVPNASVVFHPIDVQPGERGGPHQANGGTDANGRFKLRTINKEGIWPGSYKVTVSKRVLPPDKKEEFERTGTIRPDPPPGLDPELLEEGKKQGYLMPMTPGVPINVGDFMEETLPEIYLKESTTPLTIEIPEGGTKEAKVELESAP